MSASFAAAIAMSVGYIGLLVWMARVGRKWRKSDMANSPSDLQKEFEEVMRREAERSNNVQGIVGDAAKSMGIMPGIPGVYTGITPTYPKSSANDELLQRLHQRMNWAKVTLFLRGVYAAEMPDKVVVFLALQDKYLVLEDDPANFPSDKLIAALRLLQ